MGVDIIMFLEDSIKKSIKENENYSLLRGTLNVEIIISGGEVQIKEVR